MRAFWALLAIPSFVEAGTVFWSPQIDVFGPGKQYMQDTDVATWLGQYLGGASFAAPELLIFSNNGISGDISTKLRSVIEAAPSSAVAPFADGLVGARVPGEHLDVASWEDAHALLSSRPALASNGVCDMVVVAAAVDEEDHVFAAFRSRVQDATGGAALFALVVHKLSSKVAVASDYVEVMTASTLPTSRRLSTSTNESPKKYVRMTPDLLAGILTGILLVVIALIGLCCLNSIQTPSIFTSKNFPSSREY
jgi:hypothetical protein